MAVQVSTPEPVKAAATEVGLALTDDDIRAAYAFEQAGDWQAM